MQKCVFQVTDNVTTGYVVHTTQSFGFLWPEQRLHLVVMPILEVDCLERFGRDSNIEDESGCIACDFILWYVFFICC